MKLMFYLDTKYIWLQSQFEYFDLNPSLIPLLAEQKTKISKIKGNFVVEKPSNPKLCTVKENYS